MVFSSNAFLFFFLPIVLGFYYLFRKNRTAANTILTVFSLLFYAWGEPAFVLIMLASIFMNWLFALGIDRYRAGKCAAKAIVVVSCVMNIGLLGVFKYTSFVVTNLNKAFSLSIPDPGLALPIGISFFTFQAMSYVIDVYRQKGEVQKNFMGVCLYISFFPQLIAGPIVRYQTVADEIKNRKETVEDFCAGVRRFLVGFAKKAILANNMAIVVDKVFACSQSEMSVALMWYAAIAYLIQVYYDFSGYSDMAIGLGRMFGFHFLENFNYPFLSKSVAEFWRRWHISLTSWFRDYVFFPLGGSRVKTGRLIFNMFVVWSLTGLWHGAEWTYVVWGVGFFLVQVIEKLTGIGKHMEKKWYGHLYAMFFVVVVTVLIRSSSIAHAFNHYKTMFFLSGAPLWNNLTSILAHEYGFFFILSIIVSLPVGEWLERKMHIPSAVSEIVRFAGLIVVTIIAISYVIVGSYNPFIYFNF
ncbi:MAG: MBOAT family protein [Clostridia bacterium]|nr:MBOAT family protein [Clostridia bacterium]